jgi:hypothetical protein
MLMRSSMPDLAKIRHILNSMPDVNA